MNNKPLRGRRAMGRSCLFQLLAVMPAFLAGGCAHYSEKIAAQQVPPTSVESYECPQIASETKRVSARLDELKKVVDEAAADDEVKTTVGIAVFPPLLFFLNGDGAEAEEYGRLKGEYAALRDASRQKQCLATNPA